MTKKRLNILTSGSGTAQLETAQSYDNVGRVQTVKYPDTWPSVTGSTYSYGYDAASRLVSLTDNQSIPVIWVNNVQYGLSGELLQMNYNGNTETRTYNSRLQLTRITAKRGLRPGVPLFADTE